MKQKRISITLHFKDTPEGRMYYDKVDTLIKSNQSEPSGHVISNTIISEGSGHAYYKGLFEEITGKKFEMWTGYELYIKYGIDWSCNLNEWQYCQQVAWELKQKQIKVG